MRNGLKGRLRCREILRCSCGQAGPFCGALPAGFQVLCLENVNGLAVQPVD